ncbi:MAG: hypothetical protein K2R98_06575 [Gemmataceae bacterium]|nr:hypothetical protein [Gemmataceae bacterium]
MKTWYIDAFADGTVILGVLAFPMGVWLGLHPAISDGEWSPWQSGLRPTVEVIVAKSGLPQGTYIKTPELMFEARTFPRGSEPPAALWNMEELRDKCLQRSLDAGQAVSQKDLGCSEGGSRRGSLRVRSSR